MFKTKTKTPVCLGVSFSLWISSTPPFSGRRCPHWYYLWLYYLPLFVLKRIVSVILSFPDQCHLISTYSQPKQL